jgi:hypothetical protein
VEAVTEAVIGAETEAACGKFNIHHIDKIWEKLNPHR